MASTRAQLSGKVARPLPPLVTLAVIIGLWMMCTYALRVPDYVLPSPGAVVHAFVRGYIGGEMWPHFFATLSITIAGFVAGSLSGLVIGVLVSEYRIVDRFISPYLIGFQSMPKVALAPLLLVWFGFGPSAKVLLVAIICFFPVFINTQVGLRSVNPDLLDLMRAFSASRSEIFYQIRLPSAAGHIFAGLQIAGVLSLIGAVVAEFVSSTVGLGHLIQSTALNLDTGLMFASILSLGIMGVVINEIIRVTHRRVVFWEAHRRNTES